MFLRRIVAVSVLIVLAACGSGGGTATKSSASSPDATEESSSSESVQPGKTTFGPDEDDQIITAAVTDVERYYSEVFPQLYQQPFAPIAGGLFPYGPDDPPPA